MSSITPMTVLIETAECDLQHLLEQLHLGETITMGKIIRLAPNRIRYYESDRTCSITPLARLTLLRGRSALER